MCNVKRAQGPVCGRGETQLADARAGYDALSADLKASIEELGAYHSTEFSQANDLGDFPKRDKSSIYHGEAYYRPLVKVHPETGEKEPAHRPSCVWNSWTV